ncbi:MAG: hypothetical protein FWG16_06975, partial [Micrococcales bacterium]|nr:hypothetical protein [Micrococcales bacterium]
MNQSSRSVPSRQRFSSPLTSIRQRLRGLRKPLTILTVIALGMGGVGLVQGFLAGQRAHAANGTVTWVNPVAALDREWLIYSAQGRIDAVRNPTAPDTASSDQVQLASGQGISGNISDYEMNAVATGPDPLQGDKQVIYSWRTDGQTTGCLTSQFPIKKLTPGSTIAEEHCVPQGGGVTVSDRAWFGGVVVRNTGDLLMSGSGQANSITNSGTGNYRYQICTPSAARDWSCRTSSTVQAATLEDYLPGGATMQYRVSSGMAIDAEGNFYSIATQRTNTDIRYLIKVRPGRASEPWLFQRVMPITNGNLNANSWLYAGSAIAFSSGTLFTPGWAGGAGTPLSEFDLLTGQVWAGDIALPYTPGSLASAATAKNIRGHVYIDENGDGEILAGDLAKPAVGVTVELYKANSSRAIGTAQTDGTGEYNFLVGDIDPAGNSVWYVRVKQPKIDGRNARQTYAAGYTQTIVTGQGTILPGIIDDVHPMCNGVEM